ncbi:MAG: TonB-dependent receptor [Rhodanobacter sp.]
MMQRHTTHRSRLRRSTLAIALGVSLCSGMAFAQSTVGSIYGNADAGAVVQVQNLGNGFNRSATAGADGKFALGSLSPGNYRVTVSEHGRTVVRDVQVVAGQGFNLNLAADAGGSGAQTLGTVQVSANALPPIDVSSVETTTVFTAKQMHDLPIARNQTSVALLAPGTVKADSAFGNLAVFNGASAAENSYYVNGFNVTNQFQTLAFSDVPFEAIDQEEVKSGGYGAQYGNSTGGVVSVITKRGTNTWTGGAKVSFAPARFAETDPDRYANNGQLQAVNDRDKTNSAVYSAWMGGPVIKDKLFVFGLYQATRENQERYGDVGQQQAAGAVHSRFKDPTWLLKLDWNINDSNILEYTGFNDTQKTRRDVYYLNSNSDAEPVKGDYQGTEFLKTGGQVNIFKYTGYLTDDLTLSAQYGNLKNSRDDFAYPAGSSTPEYYDGNPLVTHQPGCPSIQDDTAEVTEGATPISGCSFVGTLNQRGGRDTRKNWRVDLEWKLGDHDIKGGYDHDDWNSRTGSALEGGVLWDYYLRPSGTDPGQVFQEIFSTGASVDILQDSYYLEDTWHVTDNFLAYAGLRNDSFKNRNGDGDTYVAQDNIWQPRLGFSWDVHGDSTLKVYGSAGDYSLPIAANVALRGASASVFHIEDFSYTRVDPVTGAPLDPVSLGDGQYINGEAGQTPPPGAVADRSLKPYQQREFILGATRQVADWTFGVKGMYRKLNNAIDDFCDFRPFQAWAARNGLDASAGVPPTMPGCWLFNPGRGATYDIDVDGNGTLDHVVLSAADMGQPKARRTFESIELSANRVWDRTWYLNMSYVWARSRGNTEGLVKSDVGQTDTGTTLDFDYPELMAGAYGYLPNDRRHTVKAYGGWQASPEWLVGANFYWQTGRPENCFGKNPIDDAEHFGYRNSYFYCDGHVVPRGSRGTTPATWQLDLTFAYTPQWFRGLRLQMDIDNVFNRRGTVKVDENGENGGGVPQPNSYLGSVGWQPPRLFRLTASYDFTL